MTLSSSEAEWVSILEAIKEIMFMIKMLRSMKILVKLLIMVRVDKVGVTFMT